MRFAGAKDLMKVADPKLPICEVAHELTHLQIHVLVLQKRCNSKGRQLDHRGVRE